MRGLDPWTKVLAKRGKRMPAGGAIATIAFYGPDNRRATKVVVGISEGPEVPVTKLRKWFSIGLDVRADRRIGHEVTAFLRDEGIGKVVMTRGIFGCPHEEGIDYPLGSVCPECPYWATHDRFDEL